MVASAAPSDSAVPTVQGSQMPPTLALLPPLLRKELSGSGPGTIREWELAQKQFLARRRLARDRSAQTKKRMFVYHGTLIGDLKANPTIFRRHLPSSRPVQGISIAGAPLQLVVAV